MSSPSIIFGLSEFPRPPKMGYFYYKLPPKFSEWNVRTIAVLDLYNVDEKYLSNIFHEGIKNMLLRERLLGEAACSILENYDNENIRVLLKTFYRKLFRNMFWKSGLQMTIHRLRRLTQKSDELATVAHRWTQTFYPSDMLG